MKQTDVQPFFVICKLKWPVNTKKIVATATAADGAAGFLLNINYMYFESLENRATREMVRVHSLSVVVVVFFILIFIVTLSAQITHANTNQTKM